MPDEGEKTLPVRSTTPVRNGVLKGKAVGALVREVGAQNHKLECLKSEAPDH